MTHMNMRLPSTEGRVITIKADQKTTRKCYKSSLKNVVEVLEHGAYWLETLEGGTRTGQ